MATIIGTGRIDRPDLLTPELVKAENAALIELGRIGAVDAAFMHEGRTEFTLLLTVDSIEAAAGVLQQLPLVSGGQLRMTYAVVEPLLTPAWSSR